LSFSVSGHGSKRKLIRDYLPTAIERTAKSNKAYHANSKLIKSKLLKKNTKMKIYKAMIRPVVPIRK
jgi:hypothetical protein